MDSATQNPVKLEMTSLAAREHKLNILLVDTGIVLHVNLCGEFHFESRRPPSLVAACGHALGLSKLFGGSYQALKHWEGFSPSTL